MSSDQIKFCKDCAYCVPAVAHEKYLDQMKYSKCGRAARGDSLVHPDLIDGLYCGTERESALDTRCGPGARFFKPKDPA